MFDFVIWLGNISTIHGVLKFSVSCSGGWPELTAKIRDPDRRISKMREAVWGAV